MKATGPTRPVPVLRGADQSGQDSALQGTGTEQSALSHPLSGHLKLFSMNCYQSDLFKT